MSLLDVGAEVRVNLPSSTFHDLTGVVVGTDSTSALVRFSGRDPEGPFWFSDGTLEKITSTIHAGDRVKITSGLMKDQLGTVTVRTRPIGTSKMGYDVRIDGRSVDLRFAEDEIELIEPVTLGEPDPPLYSDKAIPVSEIVDHLRKLAEHPDVKDRGTGEILRQAARALESDETESETKLFHVSRTNCTYDEYDSFVIGAHDSDHALRLAVEREPGFRVDRVKGLTIEEIHPDDGEIGIILGSFNTG